MINQMEKVYERASETAKKIRQALKQSFPGVKFSVRSSTYSIGSSVDVSYVDAIPSEQVEAVVNQFQSGYYDGMQDMYIQGFYEFEGKLYCGAKHLFVSRTLSDEYRSQIEEYATSKGYNINDHRNIIKAEKEMLEESKQAEEPQETVQSEVVASEEITISLNEEKQGIEIQFTSKPSESTLSALRSQGFKWYGKYMKWIAKQTPERLEFIQTLIPSKSETVEIIETVETVKAPESIQQTNDYNHLIGRKVLGNWGSAGFDYGIIKDIQSDTYGTDIIIKWDDSEELNESRQDIKNIVVDYESINAIGIYLIEIETIQQETEVNQEPINSEASEQIKVKSITFEWSESSLIQSNTIVSTFAEANQLIHSAASHNSGGYDKTAFIIEWVDGRTHNGRIDIDKSHLNKSNPLGEHVKYFYEMLAGLRKPNQCTWEEHYAHLESIYKIDEQGREEMKKTLDTYLLEDIAPIEPTPNNKPNNVISLADRREKKQKEKEEQRQLQLAQKYFLEEVLPFMSDLEKQKVLNLSDDPKKFASFLLELSIECKLRQS